MTLADLQSNISISAQNAVTGDIEWCSGYTGFSDDIGEQAGWYLALKVSPSAQGSALEGATIIATYAGTVRTLEDGETFIIRLAEGEDSITFTANKEGYTEGRLTLDLSGLDKETITNYCYVTSLTNGVTVTPLQFGESKTLSGIVPYDTTTSSNHFRLKYRTFIPIPAGSQISVSHFGTELGSSTFSTVTPQEGEPYSEATVDITITQDILDSQSPGLSTLIVPDTGEVLDRFYCSLGVENLTLEAAPLEALWYNLTGSKTYNDVTYTNEDLITGGTITRDNNSNVHRLNNMHFKWHPEFLDDIWDTNGYGVILTTNNSAYAEYYSRAIPLTELRFSDNVVTEKNEWYTLPHSYLVKWPQNGAISAVHWNALDGSTTKSGQGPIYPTPGITYESDPRNTVPATVTYLQEGSYNNIPITSYFTASSLTSNSSVTLYNQSGYYVFLKIATSESDLSIRFKQMSVNNLNPISYTDVTSDITGVTLGNNDIILKLDISTLNIRSSNTGITLQLAKQGFKPALNAFELQNSVYNLSTYTNGLTGRNIGISPLSSTVKSAGFEDYCDITFTPIDPATATVVNDEITVSVSGTLKKKSTLTYLSAPSTDYIPMYKNYTNTGLNIAENISQRMNIDAKYYYIIFEAENIIPVNSGTWKCSGVSSGNESSPPVTDAELYYPMIINGTSHKAIWAIHIPENQTSVSIHCIPTNKNEFTEVTYTFDLTNVTYGTIS